MTQTTDKRQLRLTFSAILKHYGLDSLEAEIKLTEAAATFFEQTKKGIDPVKVRGDILDGVLSYLDDQRQHEAMENRIAQAVKVTPNGSDTWNAIVKWCIQREQKDGQTIEKYASWLVADKYAAPKVGQIAMKPSIIKDTWRAAFENTTPEQYTLAPIPEETGQAVLPPRRVQL